jgi:hypothetical protein
VPRKKAREFTIRGGQLLARGDVIQLMDDGTLLKCRVLSCLAADEGKCYCALEIIEGERKGERIETLLRAGERPALSDETQE